MDAPLDRLGVAALQAWTPVRVRATSGEIDWALVDEPLTEPFFEQSADRAMQHPFNLAFARRTPVTVLDELRASAAGLAPDGFVFHMSRCGSTLIAQMLAQVPATIVLSEPQPLDALLRLRGQVDDATLLGWLRGMVSALAQPRRGERRLFVKFHAWHVLELPFIVRAFPDVPWIFVFREPHAVLRSHEKTAGAELLPGAVDPAHLGLDEATAREMPSAEYGATVIAAFCEAALQNAGLGRSAFVPYAALPEIVITRLLDFFAVRAGGDDVRRIRDAARRDTKGDGRDFQAPTNERAAAGLMGGSTTRLEAAYAALRAAALP